MFVCLYVCVCKCMCACFPFSRLYVCTYVLQSDMRYEPSSVLHGCALTKTTSHRAQPEFSMSMCRGAYVLMHVRAYACTFEFMYVHICMCKKCMYVRKNAM